MVFDNITAYIDESNLKFSHLDYTVLSQTLKSKIHLEDIPIIHCTYLRGTDWNNQIQT